MPRDVPTPPIEELAAAYLDGTPLTDLATEANVSPQTIGRRLRAAGIELRGLGVKSSISRHRLSEAKRKYHVPLDDVRKLRDKGLSVRDISEQIGIPEEPIREAMVAAGIPRLPAKARPERNHFWNGGRTQDVDGYWLVKMNDHPFATASGYVREHRLVMESVLGRYLLPTEVVDHIDGDPANNDPSNLQLFPSNAAHLRATLAGKPKQSRNPYRQKQEASNPVE
jgi:lambda repressor-like predicted transcriptional regulator